MAIGDILGGLGGIAGGYLRGTNQLQQIQEQQYRAALQQLAAQQYLRQQQADPAAFQTLLGGDGNLMGGGGGTAQPSAVSSYPPDIGNMSSGLDVRGSWFGNAPGWRDPSDSGLQASGVPVSAGPGIALPDRSTLGQTFDVTAPSGQTMRLPQTDIGPAKWTGRGVDINAPAAQAFGYTPQNFPTDAIFRVKQVIDSQTSPDVNAVGKAAAQLTTRALPAGFAGQLDPTALARAIDKANPNLPDDVKMAAFKELFPMLSNAGRAQFVQLWDQYKFGAGQEEKQREFDIRQQEVQQNRAVMQDIARERLSQGQQRIAQTQQRLESQIAPSGEMSESDKDFWANVLRTGGHLPPGLSRTAAGSRLVQELMARVPGASGGDPGAFIANASTVKADDRSLSNMTKMADAATSFERTANANFDTALRLSKDAVPTDWGPWINAWVMNGETQAGNKDVPPYVAALLTAANEYAKIMSGSTGAQGSTVDSRREAAQLFSPYLSSGQIDRVVAIAKTDMANRKQSLYGQIDDIKNRLRAAGSGEATATQGQKSEPSAASVPVPDAFKNDPDGTGYDKDNAVWVKQGNRLIKTPGATATPQ